MGGYPWLTAWCGDIDITGHRRPQSYYREIVFGLRADPYLAVQRPEHHGEAAAGTPWSWTDVVSSWSWAGREGAPVTVEVYADADEVELLVNGRSVGRRPAAQRTATGRRSRRRTSPGRSRPWPGGTGPKSAARRSAPPTGRCCSRPRWTGP